MSEQQLWDVVRQRRDQAEKSLTDQAGGRSLCAIARSGESMPAAKYHEGAVSALVELERNARRTGLPDTMADVRLGVEAVAARWRRLSSGSVAAGADWTAYFRGGLDALDDLAEFLRAR